MTTSKKITILHGVGISDKQQKNIRLLADFLLKLPVNYTQFDMSQYRCEFEDGLAGRNVSPIELKPVKDPTTLHTCGTSGCAIGHAPMVVGVTKPKKYEGWTDYSHRFLFDLLDSCAATNAQDKVWEWCFSGDWSEIDNTPQGAAKRMLFLLNNPSYVIDEWDVDEFSGLVVKLYTDAYDAN